MARRVNNTALWMLGGAAVLALALLAESEVSKEAAPAKPPVPPPPKPPQPRKPDGGPNKPPSGADDAHDDETALARMLASEDRREAVKIVIGWLTVQRARRRKVSVYQMITAGMGYGPQERGDMTFYASTQRTPSAKDRQLAGQLLAGLLRPSATIRKHMPGSWVERKVTKSVSDDRIIDLQHVFNEGIYGIIDGTGWVLYSRDSPKIQIAPFANATARLDAVRRVPALDPLLT